MGTKQGDPRSSLLFNTVVQVALKDDFHDGERKKEWVFAHEYALCWRGALVCFNKREAPKKCGATSSIAQKRWDSRYIQDAFSRIASTLYFQRE